MTAVTKHDTQDEAIDTSIVDETCTGRNMSGYVEIIGEGQCAYPRTAAKLIGQSVHGLRRLVTEGTVVENRGAGGNPAGSVRIYLSRLVLGNRELYPLRELRRFVAGCRLAAETDFVDQSGVGRSRKERAAAEADYEATRQADIAARGE